MTIGGAASSSPWTAPPVDARTGLRHAHDLGFGGWRPSPRPRVLAVLWSSLSRPRPQRLLRRDGRNCFPESAGTAFSAVSTRICSTRSRTHLTVDVVKGRGSGFSVEVPESVRFMIRSRLMETGTPFA